MPFFIFSIHLRKNVVILNNNLQNRINEYNNKTMPVKDFYAAQNKYKGINGIGEIEGIFTLLCNEIEQAI